MSDEYLTLKELMAYWKISERTARAFINRPADQALPTYRPGGKKILVRRSEADAWFTQFRQRGKAALTENLHALGLDRLAITRKPLARADRSGVARREARAG